MVINHNISAMFVYRNLMINGGLASKAMERLSSGMRINRAGDDPAGLAISERMRGQIRGLQASSRNVQDGISMLQVAEGGVNETHSILQRMRELAVQAANGTNSPSDLKCIQAEIDQLAKGINDISGQTQFNTINLLDGKTTAKGDLKLQSGPNVGNSYDIKLEDMSSSGLGLDGTPAGSNLDVSTPKKAGDTIKKIDDAIEKASSFRGYLGASINTLEHRMSYLENAELNLTEAESRIRDADMAKEMMNYAKYNILQQVGQTLLAQVLKQPNSTLELLKSMM